MVLFAGFVTLAILKRRRRAKPQALHVAGSHQPDRGRRRPLAVRIHQPADLSIPFVSALDLAVDLFLVPMIVWDVVSRGRLHPVTLWGGLALIANQLLRFKLAATGAWLAFAGWAVRLVS